MTVNPNWSTNSRFGIGIFEFRLDYWLHFASYFGLSALYILWQFNFFIDKRFNLQIFMSFAVFISIGLTTEIVQMLIPGRTTSLKDFIANSIGITLAYFSYLILRPIIRNSKYLLVAFSRLTEKTPEM
jgi:VanZ family protein